MELEATWSRIALIWWALIWRLLLAGVLASATGIVTYLIGHSMHAEPGPLLLWSKAIWGLTWCAISIIPVRMVITSSLGAFRVALLPTNIVLPRTDGPDAEKTVRV